MKHFDGHTAQSIYHKQLSYLLNQGEHQSVRGRHTVEILDAVTEIHQPWHPCILIPSRRWNPWLALSEGLWILAGRSDVQGLLPYNSHIVEYSDNGETLYGAYGKRIYNQIDYVIERLKNDPNDRRAVLQIWDALSDEHESRVAMGDLTVASKDPPCNNLVYFKLRSNRLHMTVINRSNDIHYGLYAVNIPTFQMLQQYIAGRLGVRVGYQTHLSNSLHVYTDDARANTITQNMNAGWGLNDIQPYPNHDLMFDTSLVDFRGGHQNFAAWCSMALEGKPFDNGPVFLRFAREFLRMYRERDFRPELLDQQYADWIQAGKNYVEAVWK
jgi:thymidylate synthase